MLRPWEKAYNVRIWRKYKIELDSEEYRKLMSVLAKSGLQSCGSGSQFAAEYWERYQSVDGLFFFDDEQILGMDADKIYGEAFLGNLTEEWMGNAAGCLVFGTFEGVTDTPPAITVGVAA